MTSQSVGVHLDHSLLVQSGTRYKSIVLPPSPFPLLHSPLLPQVFTESVIAETRDAVDLVLLIDDSGSMHLEHEWLLAMVPQLEAALIKAGVGDHDNRNRYCVIAFGGIGPQEAAHFVLVNGERCFTADQFPKARVQLRDAGLNEDGYEAIHFAIMNVPFRDSPFVAKNLVLITDEGRTVIPQGEDLTKESIRDELLKNDILLNVVVNVTYNDTMSPTEVVLGQRNGDNTYLLHPNGEYVVTTAPLAITKVCDEGGRGWWEVVIRGE